MKKILLLAISFVTVLALSACGGEENLSLLMYSPSGGNEEVLQEMLDAYTLESGKEVDVEIVAYADYYTKLQSLIAAGNAPDVYELGYENFIDYANKDVLLSLDSYMGADYDSSSINQEAFAAFQYDGDQKGMVISFSNVVMFYNQYLFDVAYQPGDVVNGVTYTAEMIAAGDHYPQVSWTWDDEVAASLHIQSKIDDVWGTYQPLQFWESYKVMAQAGGNMVDSSGKIKLDTAENAAGIQYIIDKTNLYEISPTKADLEGTDDGTLFKEGKIAMIRTGIWMFGGFSDVDFDWDIQLEPTSTEANGVRRHQFFSNALVANKDTEKGQEAWDLISFLSTSEAATSIRVENSWELPAVTSTDVLAPYLEKSNPESRDVVFSALDTLVLPPVVDNISRIQDILHSELDKALAGEQTALEALQAAQAKIEEEDLD